MFTELLDVAEGLTFLHENYTAHGDLKGVGIFFWSLSIGLMAGDQSNVLIDSSGHARLTGFGFASVVCSMDFVLATEMQEYTARWTAPEVLESGYKNTREADIFVFGMVVIEVSPCVSNHQTFNMKGRVAYLTSTPYFRSSLEGTHSASLQSRSLSRR